MEAESGVHSRTCDCSKEGWLHVRMCNHRIGDRDRAYLAAPFDIEIERELSRCELSASCLRAPCDKETDNDSSLPGIWKVQPSAAPSAESSLCGVPGLSPRVNRAGWTCAHAADGLEHLDCSCDYDTALAQFVILHKRTEH